MRIVSKLVNQLTNRRINTTVVSEVIQIVATLLIVLECIHLNRYIVNRRTRNVGTIKMYYGTIINVS